MLVAKQHANDPACSRLQPNASPTNAMKRYSPPTLSDYGSIADCTFATPAQGGDPQQPGGGPFACGPTAGLFDTGGKSQQGLQCDKFGEYANPDTFGTQAVS